MMSGKWCVFATLVASLGCAVEPAPTRSDPRRTDSVETDYSEHFELIPFETHHAPPHKLMQGDCSVYRADEDHEISIDQRGEDRRLVVVDLPLRIDERVPWNDTELTNVADIQRAEDGTTTLSYEIHRYWADTGEYYSRDRATIVLNADGSLQSVQATSADSNRIGWFVGPFEPFVTTTSISCP